MNLAEQLASYACSVRYSDLGKKTVDQLKMRLVDASGCALGSFEEEPVRIARRMAKREKGGRSTVFGESFGVTPETATFANGLMIRYFDFNDTYLSKEPAHPSDNLSACLAVAESEKATGEELLAAAAVAYEVQCRLCDAASLRTRGWDHVNYGLVSTALAASKLMGLDEERSTQAVNIALSGHIAMRQVRAGKLSMWKGASFADAARNGVFAARLARDGMTGPSPIFEGEMGFFRQVSGPFSLNVKNFGKTGDGFKVNDTYIKYWPAEYHAQSAIWAALEVRKRIKDIERADSVLVETHEAGYSILAKDREKWKPTTKETADHSLPFMVGTALLNGKVTNESYSEDNIHDRRMLKFLQKITVQEDPRLTDLYPGQGIPNRLTVMMPGGVEATAQVVVPRGHPLNPMSRPDVEAKFLGLCSHLLGPDGAKRAMRELWAVDGVSDIGRLFNYLRVSRNAQNRS